MLVGTNFSVFQWPIFSGYLLPSGLARLTVSVANGSPIEVAHAFRRVIIPRFGPELIFSTQIAAPFQH